MQIIKSNNNIFFNVVLFLFLFSIGALLRNLLLSINYDFNFPLMVLGFCIYIPILFRIKSKNFFLFDPFVFFALWFSLIYHLTSVYLYSLIDIKDFHFGISFDPLNKSNIDVIYILSFGILLFYFGYLITEYIFKLKGNVIKPNIEANKFEVYKRPFIILYLVSILFRLIAFSVGAMGSLTASRGGSNPLQGIPFISILFFISNSWPIYFFYMSSLKLLKKKYNKLFYIALISEVFFMFISGNRRNIMVLAFIYYLSFYLVKKYIPVGRLIKIGVPFLVIFFPFITIFGYSLQTLDTFKINNILGLIPQVFDRLLSVNLVELFSDFLIDPIVSSFSYFGDLCLSYTRFTLKGVEWGAIGPQNLVDKLIPSFIYSSSFDERYYFDTYTYEVLPYSVDYSFLTITAQTEQFLSYGKIGVFGGMFIQGLVSCFLFRIFNSYSTPILLRIVYLGLLFKFSINFTSSLLVTDLVFGFRILLYACFLYVFLRPFIRKKVAPSLH